MEDWLMARSRATPHKLALVADDRSEATFQELDAAAQVMAARWSAAGVRQGDNIGAIQLDPMMIFAALRCGAVLVPVNTRLTPDEIRGQLHNADCTWILADDDSAADFDGGRVLSAGQLPAESFTPARVDLDAPLVIVHTSGTSGQPKGAMLTAGNLYHSATAAAYRLGVLPSDRWLCSLPLYHVGGLSILLRACLYGITVDLHAGFDLHRVNAALCNDGITLVSLVPTMLYRLLEHGTPDRWPDLRCILLGGAAAPADLLERCAAYDLPVATTYGLSEAASQVATATPALARRKPGTVGKPLMFTQVQVIDEGGDACPAGEYGEVIVQGPTVMRGYYNAPNATAATLRQRADGPWLHTGDIGYLDADGDLFLVQRRSDLIVSGGENVYPAEVETVLKAHPAVKAVAVVGLPHPEWGQQVAAAVTLQPAARLDAETLITYSRERLAGYKLPRRVVFVDALPQTASGKIQRDAVIALFKGTP
jgi:o-succinylbenzoate---CoA ligase